MDRKLNTPVTNNSNDYSLLPNVVLTKIYSYLSLKDRLNASVACKSWRLALFNPCLWHEYKLSIYLCNRLQDVRSAYFKSHNLSRYTPNLAVKYEPNDLVLFEHVCKLFENLKRAESNGAGRLINKNLKQISLQPYTSDYFEIEYDAEDGSSQADEMFEQSEQELCSFRNDDNEDIFNSFDGYCDDYDRNLNFGQLNKKLFGLLKEIILDTKCLEHLGLGLLSDLSAKKENLIELLAGLNKKHLFNLKSLHISTIQTRSIASLVSKSSFGEQSTSSSSSSSSVSSPTSNSSSQSDSSSLFSAKHLESTASLVPNDDGLVFISDLLCQFINLSQLSIDYNDLSDEFLKSTVCLISLKK